MRFSWDEQKRRTNIVRHGIDFVDAAAVFETETHTKLDNRFDYGEVRFLTIGMVNGRILAVSHSEEEGLIRIISVRKAEKHEQETYFKKIRN